MSLASDLRNVRGSGERERNEKMLGRCYCSPVDILGQQNLLALGEIIKEGSDE